MNTGPWMHYRYSKVFQCHYFVVGLFAAIWRFGSYKPRSRPQKGTSDSGEANGA